MYYSKAETLDIIITTPLIGFGHGG